MFLSFVGKPTTRRLKSPRATAKPVLQRVGEGRVSQADEMDHPQRNQIDHLG
jgi:hypothetical protein